MPKKAEDMSFNELEEALNKDQYVINSNDYFRIAGWSRNTDEDKKKIYLLVKHDKNNLIKECGLNILFNLYDFNTNDFNFFIKNNVELEEEVLFNALTKNININVIQLILDTSPKLISLNINDEIISTALHRASSHASLNSLKLILKKFNGNVHTDNKKKIPVLFSAISGDKTENIAFLLSKGAKVVYQDYNGKLIFALHISIVRNNKLPTIKEIIKYQGINTKNEEGDSAINLMARYYSIENIEFMTNEKADILLLNKEGDGFIHKLMERRNIKEIATLIDRYNFDINQKNNLCKTPLMFAAEHSKSKLVDFLIKKGADIHQEDNEGNTALFYRSYRSDKGVFKTLIDAGSDINHQNKLGNTPLINEFNKKNIDTINLLISRGADPFLSNLKGKTIEDIMNRKRKKDKFKKLAESVILSTLLSNEDNIMTSL